MLKVKIEAYIHSIDKNGKWHDLMTKAGTKDAYQHLDDIYANDKDYIITDIKTDWARFDGNTSLDDMVETVNVLKDMIDDEMILFKKLYSEGIHEPLDIAKSIRYNEIKYSEDILEDDEIWETVFFDKEQKEIAILY
ncbi:hypothetical protein [Salinicoccus albus]|uniref:hypothetical protein n=1 Tax=Salinicoccus albus TaxID=418756 RepID=UPI0003819425|nr:hypothetical protein [Salinicoccus albus]